MRKYITALMCILCICLSGCSKVYYYYNDAVSFRLENNSEREIYAASISFGIKDRVFGSMVGENADGIALADKGDECLVFPVEKGDLNDSKLEDMVFEFFVCTMKDNDFTYVGTVTVKSSKLHATYTLILEENDGKLTLTSNDKDISITIDNE